MAILNNIEERNSDEFVDDQRLRALLWDKTVNYLSRRDHSHKELKRKLLQVSFQKSGKTLEPERTVELIDDCLNRARELGYLDENRFAEMLIRSRQGRGYGPVRIKMELAEHQICTDESQFGLDESESLWVDNIVEAIVRKSRWHDLETPVVKQKVLRHFYNKGFSQDQIVQAIELAIETLNER